MKYYLIAGEASGDLHGANLMHALKKVDTDAEFRFWGGDAMQAEGGSLVKHYKERSFMGFAEVVLNISKIFKDISLCKKDIEAYQPDALIFIDNSGFNLRIAKWAKEKGFYTNYYISPQVWASRAKRVQAIKRDIDAMYVILPFVEDFYKDFDYEVNFVGHPLLDAIHKYEHLDLKTLQEEYNLDDRPIIALLPGSRKQEISKMLSVMLSVTNTFKDYQFIIAGAPSQDKEFYEPYLKKSNIHLIMNRTYDILTHAHAALVTSGTATLETALFNVPEIVCYKGNFISYHIAKRIIKLNYISLVNLIMNREVVKELIQNELDTENLTTELHKILETEQRDKMLNDYEVLERKLGGVGASLKAAKLIVANTKKKKQ
ncbi:lipid-A-disaccharide synthase [Zunongwangia sp.]|uniref:lipid-A-disaccharide synthase n=1 Tax=Zunongwangia sp. TaxID=1965325 RepID=UPI003AA8DCBD